MRAYWFGMEPNFGDMLTPYIIRRMFGVQLEPCRPDEAELFSIGSVASAIPEGFTGHILGTGIMSEGERYDWTAANVIGLRGHLTAERVKHCGNPVLGDPALILDRFAQKVQRKWALGIIPHYVDKDNEQVALWAEVPRVCIVDIQANPDEVMAQVAACETIVSSSLHGLVLADALEIPNKWVCLSDKIGGGNFKFHDYYSVFGIRPEPTTSIKYVDSWERPGLLEIKDRLYQMIAKFGASQGWGLR